ncbi:MAG TPA: pitrilysin family protein [Chthonomonadaceae bacterium]|nr:pitrilysin family protein [Chthonomonadaceae bacterium]
MKFNRNPQRWWGAFILTVLLATSAGLPARAQPPNPEAAAQSVKPPRLNYQMTTLPNGLKVITLEDHRAPVVTLQIWYHVGSKDEAPGKAGFAHLFEHLMFKGSAHVGPEEHARYIEQIGGQYNANTFYDRTLFFETVPDNALDRVLWLEADRMASLRVDEKNMRSERAVVEEEHRLDVENAPYGRMMEILDAMLFPPSHPYAHPTIGVMADLDRATLADVRAFHNEYYKPNDATLVLVGDFKRAEALDRIRRYFGPIPAATKPFTRYPVPPIQQTAEKRQVVYDKLAPLPMVVMAYRLPPADSPDTPVLRILAHILSTGESSRLYRSLVRDKQIATEVEGSVLALKLGGIFFFSAIGNAGVAPDVVEKALVEEVDKLRSSPVSPEELTKAKNQALTGLVFGRLSTEQKASALGQADLLYGTPEEANREYEKLAAVTAADIQRVAQTYFGPDERNVLYLLPASMQPKAAVPAGPSVRSIGASASHEGRR